MQAKVLQQVNAIFFPVIISKITWFSCSLLYFDLYAGLFFSIVWYIYIKSNCSNVLFFFYFFQSFWCDGKTISFLIIYWLNKRFNFDILWQCLSIFWWICATVKAYWKQLSSFLFFGFIVALLFLTIQENLHMILLFSDLFHENNNTKNQHFHE